MGWSIEYIMDLGILQYNAVADTLKWYYERQAEEIKKG